jgi:hypothetical protein
MILPLLLKPAAMLAATVAVGLPLLAGAIAYLIALSTLPWALLWAVAAVLSGV